MQGTGPTTEWAVGEAASDPRLRMPSGTLAVGGFPYLLGDLIRVFLALLLPAGVQSTSLGCR